MIEQIASLMMRSAFFILLLSHFAHSSEALKLSIGTTPMANIFKKIERSFEQDTGIKIHYVGKDPNGHGADQVFKDVDQDLAVAGAGGLPWPKWLELMKEKNYVVHSPLDSFKHQVIGMDRIQIFTFKGGPEKLTDRQIAALLSGKITNWKEVSTASHPVKVILSPKQPATGKFIEDTVMGGLSITRNAEMLEPASDIPALVRKVGSTPGAIGFGPLNAVNDLVNVPIQPVVGRPIVLIFKGQPKSELLQLIKYIREKGQEHGVAQ